MRLDSVLWIREHSEYILKYITYLSNDMVLFDLLLHMVSSTVLIHGSVHTCSVQVYKMTENVLLVPISNLCTLLFYSGSPKVCKLHSKNRTVCNWLSIPCLIASVFPG